jgi:diaminopimelate decarboxylase
MGKTWANMDFSVNNLMRVDTNDWHYHLLAADRLYDSHDETVDIVGPLCLGRPIGVARTMPHLRRGDLIAALDAGMYAEVASTQMNGVPRPATVLVNGSTAEVIKERESVLDVFRNHRIPSRLRAIGGQNEH